MKKFIKKTISVILSIAVLTVPVSAVPVETASAAEPIVVVIDPGHGGSNLGTDYLPIPEKVYTMVVAQYMKEELEKFQNVEVYLTHTEDVKMDLDERAAFAQGVDADFLFSLHFNM